MALFQIPLNKMTAILADIDFITNFAPSKPTRDSGRLHKNY